MKRILIPVAAVVSLAVLGAAAASTPGNAQRVARGQYLVTIGGCNDCHTPLKLTPSGPVPDVDRLLSGHPEQLVMPSGPALAQPWGYAFASSMTAFSGPWGVSFARNLTPDADTGLGAWTEADFIATLRSGHRMGHGRPLVPPMPWLNYAKASDEDLRAIFAYLRSIPAVRNRVEDPRPPGAAAGRTTP
jgi:hypothetical protein